MKKLSNKKYPVHFESKSEELLQQKGVVLWFTGLSGSGKTTLGSTLKNILHTNLYYVVHLDGDILREGINKGLGFTTEGRKENIRRTAEVAKLLVDHAAIVIVTLISPYEEDRILARGIIGSNRFFEIYVNSPLVICIKRDVKGLYKKAIEGTIEKFTGISDPYEVPCDPDLVLNTDLMTVDESIKSICTFLKLPFFSDEIMC